MYHFTLNDGVAVFAIYIVKKEIEFDGKKETVAIPAFSVKEAENIGGFEITEQHIPAEIINRAESLAGKTSSKEEFEKMLYNDKKDAGELALEELSALRIQYNMAVAELTMLIATIQGGDINV